MIHREPAYRSPRARAERSGARAFTVAATVFGASQAPRPPESWHTARLSVRRHRVEDAEAIFAAYGSDPLVSRFLTWRTHESIDDSRRWLATYIARWNGGEIFTWAITLAGDDRPIGALGCRVRGHTMHIGYLIARAHWSRGYASEAVRSLIAWGTSVPSMWRVWAVCDVENLASARVLEKVGMQREGLLRRFVTHPNASDAPRDCYAYSMVRPWA